jgi:hypothetical protein
VTDRPILFSAPMVRALLDGRKTQTRRILKDVPPSPGDDALNPNCQIRHEHAYLDAYCSANRTPLNPRGMSSKWCWWTRDDRQCLPAFNTRFAPGDRLWVRETWRMNQGGAINDAAGGQVDYVEPHVDFRADYGNPGLGWKPGIHMPRAKSRLTLTVTDVRVQRLQEISEADAIAEGIEAATAPHEGWQHYGERDGLPGIIAVDSYRTLWDSINGAGAWKANPWVVAVTFTVERRNIDA